MRPLREPSFRRLFARPALALRFQQRRWAKVHDILFNDVRFHATHTTQSRILEKYREKLSRKAKDEGLPDIAALKQAYKAKSEAGQEGALQSTFKQRAQQLLDTRAQPQTASAPPPPPVPQAVEGTAASSSSKQPSVPIKTLASFVDVDKIRALSVKEIEYVWRLRHAKSPFSLCAVIPASAYAHISLMARKYPQFILPVPREDQGAEIHFLQWTFPEQHTATVIFTQLAEYKMRGEYASPHTTLSLHTELLQDRELVLAQGSVQENRGMTPEDGKWLLMCLQKFYGAQAGGNAERLRLLQQFSRGDPDFQIQHLLDEAERI